MDQTRFADLRRDLKTIAEICQNQPKGLTDEQKVVKVVFEDLDKKARATLKAVNDLQVSVPVEDSSETPEASPELSVRFGQVHVLDWKKLSWEELLDLYKEIGRALSPWRRSGTAFVRSHLDGRTPHSGEETPRNVLISAEIAERLEMRTKKDVEKMREADLDLRQRYTLIDVWDRSEPVVKEDDSA